MFHFFSSFKNAIIIYISNIQNNQKKDNLKMLFILYFKLKTRNNWIVKTRKY